MPKGKIDAHQIRQRDTIVLPFKRNIASLSIRLDRWETDTKPGTTATVRSAAQGKAKDAIVELDNHVDRLKDVKFPQGTLDTAFAGQVEAMHVSYGRIRDALKDIARPLQ